MTDPEEVKPESEFGKGLTYCLGLFLAHAERFKENKLKEVMSDESWVEMWFNAASDHFYELVIPDFLPQELQKRLNTLRDKALHWGHGGHGFSDPRGSKEDVRWAIAEAKELLRLLDEHFGVATIKGSWE